MREWRFTLAGNGDLLEGNLEGLSGEVMLSAGLHTDGSPMHYISIPSADRLVCQSGDLKERSE